MNGKQIQRHIYDYINRAPNKQREALSIRQKDGKDGSFMLYLKEVGLVTPSTTPEEFKSLCNVVNPQAKQLVEMGLVEHLKGIRGYRIRTAISPDTQALLLDMSPSERFKKLKDSWADSTDGKAAVDLIDFFHKEIHGPSHDFDYALQFPEGSTDGLCSPFTPRYLATRSHIIEKYQTTALGIPSWDKSANVICEYWPVNTTRYHGGLTSVVTADNAIVYKVLDRNVTPDLLALDGKNLRILPAYAKGYRMAHRLRDAIVGLLNSSPTTKELLEVVKNAEPLAVEETKETE
jgi:hypothetical protein